MGHGSIKGRSSGSEAFVLDQTLEHAAVDKAKRNKVIFYLALFLFALSSTNL